MKTREDLEKQIIEKAIKDVEFRHELLENPVSAIEKASGLKLPESVNIRVLEESTDTFYLVLPNATGTSEKDELTETELLTVSGGFDWSVATDCGTCAQDCQGSNP